MPLADVPLSIAVLGCGNIGSVLASRLARAGHNVTAIARPGSMRLLQLRRDGGIVETDGSRTAVQIADQLDPKVPFELLIVTLLAHQVGSVMPALQASGTSCVLFMFNTFEPEALVDAIGAERCALGMPFVQAKLGNGDGRLRVSIGTGGQKTLLDKQRWVDLFATAGLPAALEPDMPAWLRGHAPLCVAFEAVSIAGMRRGGGASWREALVLARGVHAAFHLIKALGHPLHSRSKRIIRRSPVTALGAVLWAMSRVRSFRELLATGSAECDALVDAMLAASRTGVSVPAAAIAAIAAMKPKQDEAFH